jgi:hypothetical protein
MIAAALRGRRPVTRRNGAFPARPASVAASAPRVAGQDRPGSVIIGSMSLAQLLTGRRGHRGRLPDRLEDLHGPARGVIVLPRHLSWPGMREFDVTDDATRRSMYGIVLTQGQRNDVMRFLHPALLAQDWPLIAAALDPRLRRWCERRFALPQAPVTGGAGPAPAQADAGRR